MTTESKAEFDTYRGAVVQALRDDGYAASAAIALARRNEAAIQLAWVTGRNVVEVAREIDEHESADDTDVMPEAAAVEHAEGEHD